MMVVEKHPKPNGVVGGAIPDGKSSLYLMGGGTKTSKVAMCFLCSKTTTSQLEINKFIKLKVVVRAKTIIQPNIM
jgi:hypothetical protein